jgi:predicted DsbA family dithiol-disulfide isomerase
MHDILYENQEHLRQQDLLVYGERLGLQVDRLTTDLAEHIQLERVREDFMSGVHSGVNGTPTFFINGRRHDGSYETETLLGALERALSKET